MTVCQHQVIAASVYSTFELAALWNAAYEGYFVPVHTTAVLMADYIARLDVDLMTSHVLVVDGVPSGISMSAARGQRAYLAGFGICAPLRRQGWGTKLLDAQLRAWRETGMKRVQLEVIEQNPARSLYAKVGFLEQRRLQVFEGLLEGSADASAPQLLPLKQRALVEACRRLHAVHSPTWRRELAGTVAALGTPGGDAFGWLDSGTVVAFAVVRHTVEQAMIVDAASATEDQGEALFRALGARLPGRHWRILNEPAGSPIAAACLRTSLTHTVDQAEMVLSIL